MSIAITYRCVCDEPFVISLARGGSTTLEIDERWKELVSAVAQQSGRVHVDGRRLGFACPTCGRLHVRCPESFLPAIGRILPDEFGSELLLSAN